MSPERRGTGLRGGSALLLFLVLPLLLLAESFAPGKVLLPLHPTEFPPLNRHVDPSFLAEASANENHDTSDKVLPILTDARAFSRGLREGRVPLWDPWNAGGAPLIAQCVAGSLYPPNLILHALLGPEKAFAPLAVLTLFLAGSFTWLFLRERGLSGSASAIGGIAFAFSGYSLANLHYYVKVDALVWLPAGLLAIERIRRRPGLLATAGLGASVGLSGLAGFPQTTAYVVLALAAYGLARIGSGLGVERGRALGFAGLGGVAGLALAAIQWIPAAEASRESLRVLQSVETFRRTGLETPLLSHFLLPHLFRSPTEAPAELLPFPWLFLDRPARFNSTESALYLGVAGLGLLVAGLLRGGPGRGIAAVGFSLSLLFALASPLLLPLYWTPLARIGGPARAFAVGAFFGAWLVALGAENILKPESRRLRSALASSALALAALAGGAGLSVHPDRFESWAVPRLVDRWKGRPEAATVEPLDEATVRRLFSPDSFLQAGRRVRNDLFRLALLAGLTAVGAFSAARRRGEWVLGVILAADLFSFGRPLLAPRPGGDLFPECPPVEAARKAAGDLRLVRFDPGPELGDAYSLLRSNLPAEYGIRDLSGYMAFAPRRPVQLFEALDPKTRYRVWTARITSPAHFDHPLLDLAGIGAVLSRTPLEYPELERVHGEEGFFVYRRRNALPRAWIVPTGRVVTDEEAIGPISSGRVRPREEVLLSEGSSTSAGKGGGEVGWIRDDPERLELEVRGTGGGWLVTSEVFYPGWSATIDGNPVPIERANYAYRAVALPPGDHRIAFLYRPVSFALGAASAAAGALFLLVSFAIGARRRARLGE